MLSKEELIVLRHYAKEGLTKTAIAKTLGVNRHTVHRNPSNGKDEPEYSPRPPRPSKLDHYKVYLMGRIASYPELSPQRLLSEIQCLGYRAKTKGRVERAVSYLERSLFYGRSFRDLEDLNTQLSSWLVDIANTRIHRTTSQVSRKQLKDEHAHLNPLPVNSSTPILRWKCPGASGHQGRIRLLQRQRVLGS